jgi:hypothetical protein
MTNPISTLIERSEPRPVDWSAGTFRWDDRLGARIGRRRPAIDRAAVKATVAPFTPQPSDNLDLAHTAAFL